MRRRSAFLVFALIAVACHDSERYSPTAPSFQNALIVTPEKASLPSDGFSTLAIKGQISPAASSGSRTLVFTTTEGEWADAATAGTKTIEKDVDATGAATVHLRSSEKIGTHEVTVKVKGRDDIVKSIQVDFVASDPAGTLHLTTESTSAPADDFTATVITAQLGPSVPASARSVTFTTNAGRFLQSGNMTATVPADQNGRARVDLVGPQTPTTARVTAKALSVTQELLVQFVPALPDLILVKPAKLTLQPGFGADATTAVAIEMHRSVGKVSTGIIPTIRVVDPASGADLQFLIRGVSPSTATGTSQADITTGSTSFRGTARIEVRVEGSSTVGTALIQIVSPPPPPPGVP